MPGGKQEWPRIAVFGAGAVGCYFGGMLARAGAAVTLIGRPGHMDAIRREGLLFEGLHFTERIRVNASRDIEAARGAPVVLFCVKTTDNETAAKALAPLLDPGALVVGMQNGVDNAERIRAASGLETVPAAVYVAAAMAGPGHVRHSGRGDLVVGDARTAALFERGGVPCRLTPNMEGELWTKMIMNCVYNAISALARSRYGPAVRNPWTRPLMRQVVEEAIAVAGAAGVTLGGEDLVKAAYELGEAMHNATSSTAQDLARGKRTEIDSFNGYVARRSAELGVPTPVNATLHALVKLLEESV